ncbi:putative ABC transport system permease protein [Aequitasia blattaphilus]|uniref:ABC transporter permease n=1 Tax=Aequitasia blattaphilus TaxID=2949332 RepID=A0ABT1E617_9FIRM|nr:ABC transporter permease [Aequitasia blattaphilus]MCP1101193.1 ABC transporter permease [Aequitasia blattaphilus]MCR8613833.1 ABC transporter permease [Aequitasia blattaphilus]
MSFLISILEQGLIYGILGLGVYITYKILDFPDLTVDGSFPLGAAVTALLITKGVNPFVTLPIAFLVGMCAGAVTGLIHVKAKVRDLLSGIIMMTALWSVNLYIAGTSNVPLFSQNSIFKGNALVEALPKGIKPYATLLIIFVIAAVSKVLLDLYLKTKSGLLLRGVGDNDVLVTSLAKDQGNVKILGLAISNGLVALAGCIFAQEERLFEISMGTGSMVIGLASVIIGTSLLKKLTFIKATLAVFAGSIIYKACVAVALAKFDPKAKNFITAILFLVVLVLSMDRKAKVKKNA